MVKLDTMGKKTGLWPRAFKKCWYLFLRLSKYFCHFLGSTTYPLPSNGKYHLFTLQFHPCFRQKIKRFGKHAFWCCFYDNSLYGNKLRIESYEDNMVSLINADGVKIFVQVSAYLEPMKNYIVGNKWMECRIVCRDVKNEAMWALLAGSAVSAKQLDTAEECFLAMGQIERATFIQYIKVCTCQTKSFMRISLIVYSGFQEG